MALERSLRDWWVLAALTLAGSVSCMAQTPQFLLPSGIAYDATGNLFVADARKNQVFEVLLSGATTVVAGTGVQGFAGDGSAATLALLDQPSAVAVAVDGTIYIADTGNQRIRAVVGGQIQTVAGSGLKGFSGDGNALLAKLNMPIALAMDSNGGLLIADSGNHRLRRLLNSTLTTVAGSGVQGFTGDGAPALAAEMDTPAGVAVASDGRIFVADSHNHRIRVVSTNGLISTFAGSGVRGFSGDGGVAIAASLFLPRGLAVTAAGAVIFADSDNQRLRMIDAQGVITTVAGNGVQGNSTDGAVARTSPLDRPRGVALSSFADPVFADTHNRVIREVALDANLYLVPNVARVATITLMPAALTYGQGRLTANVSSAIPTAQGNVALLDSGVAVSSAILSNAVVMLPTDSLTAGQHTLTADFSGDGLHPAASSVAVTVTVAPLSVVATAQGTTITYGSSAPAFSGKIAGILPRDDANVVANFAPVAPDLSPVGTYPIAASLSGLASANYIVTSSPSSGTLQVVQAMPLVTMTAPQISYTGLPVTLIAFVSSATRGTPGGTVSFTENGDVVAIGNIVDGVATGIYLKPTAGQHLISATYAGDHNFLATVSSMSALTVNVMPDFLLSVIGNATQSVQGGAIAGYALQIDAQPGPFSGGVTLSASGLPSGTTAGFSPATVIPGSGSAAVVMSIQTVTSLAQRASNPVGLAGLFVFGLSVPWAFLQRKKRGIFGASFLGLVALCLLSNIGCGNRNFGASSYTSQSFPITVVATSTNLAGAVVTHTATVTLIIQ